MMRLEKVRNTLMRGWSGMPEEGDIHVISASTLAGRFPQFEKKRWMLGNMLKQLTQDHKLLNRILAVAESHPELAADRMLPFEYGAADDEGNTPAERGTDAHDLAEQFFRGETSHLDLVELSKQQSAAETALNLIEGVRALDLEPVMMEEFICNLGLGVGGRTDMIARHTRGTHHVTDFKTKRKKPGRYYGVRNYVQLQAYRSCTKVAAYEPVRVSQHNGRIYLVSPEEAEWLQDLPPLDARAYVITAWPEGWEAREVNTAAVPGIANKCRELYEFAEYMVKGTTKKVAKGGNG